MTPTSTLQLACLLCQQEHDPREHILSVGLVTFRSEAHIWRYLRECAEEDERRLQPELPGLLGPEHGARQAELATERAGEQS